MKCTDCGYHYPDCDNKGNNLSFPYCHYPYDDNCAPCEIDENDYKEEEY